MLTERIQFMCLFVGFPATTAAAIWHETISSAHVTSTEFTKFGTGQFDVITLKPIQQPRAAAITPPL